MQQNVSCARVGIIEHCRLSDARLDPVHVLCAPLSTTDEDYHVLNNYNNHTFFSRMSKREHQCLQ